MATAGAEGLYKLISERFPWVCSLWVHVGLFAVFINVAGQDALPVPKLEPVSVEIVTDWKPVSPEPLGSGLSEAVSETAQQRLAALPPEQEWRVSPSDPTARQKQAVPDKEPGPEWITATRFYAAQVLSDPRSAQARQALATLVGADRADQLCALEAMEQIRQTRPGFRPTRLAPHAVRNSVTRGNTITAKAAAVRSNHVWYEIAYKCVLDTRNAHVIGFEFALGKPIKRALWDELGLAPIH